MILTGRFEDRDDISEIPRNMSHPRGHKTIMISDDCPININAIMYLFNNVGKTRLILSTILLHGFLWRNTREGYGFWRRASENMPDTIELRKGIARRAVRIAIMHDLGCEKW